MSRKLTKPRRRATDYDLSYVKSYCNDMGLEWDEVSFIDIHSDLKELNVTQWQFDCIFTLHINHVVKCFTPKSYTFGQRIVIAMFFLFGKSLPVRR